MITEMLVVGGIVSVLVAIVFMAQLVTMKMQQQSLENIHAQQHAWERAQEVRQQQGQAILENYVLEAEKKLAAQVQQVYKQRQAWETIDTTRVQDLTRQYEAALEQSRTAYELERIPHIEDTPLPHTDPERSNSEEAPRHPINLPGANLPAYDLSARYLKQANLRHAHLAQANLYMADLSDACLAGADLSGADLSATNLTGTDLRGANLTGANFLVADLKTALLGGANLLAARNLTVEQIATALIDEDTQLDPEVDITRPRVPSVNRVFRKPMHPPREITDETIRPFHLASDPTKEVRSIDLTIPQQYVPPVGIETPLPAEPPIETPLPAEPHTPLPGMFSEMPPVNQFTPESLSTDKIGKVLFKGKYHRKKRAKAS